MGRLQLRGGSGSAQLDAAGPFPASPRRKGSRPPDGPNRGEEMKLWLTALTLALVLAAFGWISFRRAHESRVISRHPFPDAAIANTKRIQLMTLSKEKVALESRGGSWQV